MAVWYWICIVGCKVNSYSCNKNLFLEILGGGCLCERMGGLVKHLVTSWGGECILPIIPRQVKRSEVTFPSKKVLRCNNHMSLPSLSKIVTVTIAGRIKIFGTLSLKAISKVAINVSASSRTSSSVIVILKHCRLILLPNPSRDCFINRKSCESEEGASDPWKCQCCGISFILICTYNWPAVPACVFTVKLNGLISIGALDGWLMFTQISTFSALSETFKNVFSNPITNSVFIKINDYCHTIMCHCTHHHHHW